VIILACTHFLHLSGDIAAVAGPGVEAIDSREGVVRRLKQVVAEARPASSVIGGGSPKGKFLLTGDRPIEPEYFALACRFGLDEPELLIQR
jgi:glutamate racemase